MASWFLRALQVIGVAAYLMRAWKNRNLKSDLRDAERRLAELSREAEQTPERPCPRLRL